MLVTVCVYPRWAQLLGGLTLLLQDSFCLRATAWIRATEWGVHTGHSTRGLANLLLGHAGTTSSGDGQSQEARLFTSTHADLCPSLKLLPACGGSWNMAARRAVTARSCVRQLAAKEKFGCVDTP